MGARGGSFSLIQSMKAAITAKREEQSLNGSATNFLPAHSDPRLEHLEADASVFHQPGKQRITHGGDRREHAAG